MRRTVWTLMCVAGMGVWTAAAFGGDDCKGCAKIKMAGQGFCADCKTGQIFGLTLTSQGLFDTLAGSSDTLAKMKDSKCPGCKEAVENNGTCEHCHNFVASGKVYKNSFAYTLARGDQIDRAAKKSCPGCAEAVKNKSGFCSACDVGIVAGRAFKTRSFYDSATKAYETVKAAVKDASHCEMCSTARLTNGTCEHCKVAFKDGKPV